MQQPPHGNNSATPPQTPLSLVTTEQIQKYLDENKNLIMAILESQNLGKVEECAQYQAILQKNLTYLAAIADAQPQGSQASSQPQGSVPPSQPLGSAAPSQAQGTVASQPPSGSAPLHGNYGQQMQPAMAQQLQQQQQQHGVPTSRLPFQLNILQSHEQQSQALQFQQQFQGHFGGGVVSAGGLNLMMQPGTGTVSGSLMDARGNHQGPFHPGSGGAQGN